MEQKNGVILHLTPTPKKLDCFWQATQVVNGVLGKTLHSPRIELAPLKLALTPDGNSYWAEDAIIYCYFSSGAYSLLSIKLKKDLTDAEKAPASLETLKLCPQT